MLARGVTLTLVAVLLMGGRVYGAPLPASCLDLIASSSPRILQPFERTMGTSRDRFEEIKAEAAVTNADIVLLGDSEIERWTKTLLSRSFPGWSTFNAGVSGDTAQSLIWRLANGDLPKHFPPYVIVFVGTNHPGNHSPEQVAAAIAVVLQYVRAAYPKADIIDVPPVPHPSSSVPQPPPTMTDLLRRCANGEDIAVVDPWTGHIDADGRLARDFRVDGLHLSPVGYKFLGAAVRKEMGEMGK